MKIIKMHRLILSGLSLGMFISGCSFSGSEVTSSVQDRENFKTLTQSTEKKYFKVNRESIKTILGKLSKEYNVIYMLEGRDLTLKDSGYKVSTLGELKNYVYKTSDFKLLSMQPTYGNNKVYKLMLISKKSSALKKEQYNKNDNDFTQGVSLDKPMTIQGFFREFNKIKNDVYVVKGNGNLPMNKNININSLSKLKKYLKENTDIKLESRKNGNIVSIKVR